MTTLGDLITAALVRLDRWKTSSWKLGLRPAKRKKK